MHHIAPHHILELTLEVVLEVILEHVLGIKAHDIFNSGSRSNSLSLSRN